MIHKDKKEESPSRVQGKSTYKVHKKNIQSNIKAEIHKNKIKWFVFWPRYLNSGQSVIVGPECDINERFSHFVGVCSVVGRAVGGSAGACGRFKRPDSDHWRGTLFSFPPCGIAPGLFILFVCLHNLRGPSSDCRSVFDKIKYRINRKHTL